MKQFSVILAVVLALFIVGSAGATGNGVRVIAAPRVYAQPYVVQQQFAPVYQPQFAPVYQQQFAPIYAQPVFRQRTFSSFGFQRNFGFNRGFGFSRGFGFGGFNRGFSFSFGRGFGR
jgi:hypothetical protein